MKGVNLLARQEMETRPKAIAVNPPNEEEKLNSTFVKSQKRQTQTHHQATDRCDHFMSSGSELCRKTTLNEAIRAHL